MTNDDVLRAPCPGCGLVGQLHLLHRRVDIAVRGQTFSVDVAYFHCASCKTEFEGGDSSDATELAYRKYRDTNGLLQPEQLKSWRQSLGLKQSELSQLLGWSTASVSRYENGALQDDAHDRAMRAAMTPSGLDALVASAVDLPAATRQRLQARTAEELSSSVQLATVVAGRISHAAAYTVSWRKICETVLFFAQTKSVPRTKLNKLLFYADFLHAKHYGVPITGLSYVRLPHGPVPDDYELIFSAMHAEGTLGITETLVGEYLSYMHAAKRGPDMTVFDTSEMRALIRVQSEFERCSAKEISDRSHSEDAWSKTPPGSQVSLAHAQTLSLSLH